MTKQEKIEQAIISHLKEIKSLGFNKNGDCYYTKTFESDSLYGSIDICLGLGSITFTAPIRQRNFKLEVTKLDREADLISERVDLMNKMQATIRALSDILSEVQS